MIVLHLHLHLLGRHVNSFGLGLLISVNHTQHFVSRLPVVTAYGTRNFFQIPVEYTRNKHGVLSAISREVVARRIPRVCRVTLQRKQTNHLAGRKQMEYIGLLIQLQHVLLHPTTLGRVFLINDFERILQFIFSFLIEQLYERGMGHRQTIA